MCSAIQKGSSWPLQAWVSLSEINCPFSPLHSCSQPPPAGAEPPLHVLTLSLSMLITRILTTQFKSLQFWEAFLNTAVQTPSQIRAVCISHMPVSVWWLWTNIPLFTFKPWWSACNSSQIGPEPNTEFCIPKLGSALRPDGADNQFTYLLDRKISSNQLTWQGLKSSYSPNPFLWSKWEDWEPKKGCSQLRVSECQRPASCFSTQAMGNVKLSKRTQTKLCFLYSPLGPLS